MIDLKDAEGDTPLHILVKSSQIDKLSGKEALCILIEWGCNLNILDSKGKTPIQCVSQDSFAYTMLKDAEKSSSKYNTLLIYLIIIYMYPGRLIW